MAAQISRSRLQLFKILVVTLVMLFGVSCSYLGGTQKLQNGDFSKTSVGVLTGAALGAGAGAIIGSAAGSAGEGLVIGTVAGAAAGGGGYEFHLKKQRDRVEADFKEGRIDQREYDIRIDQLNRDSLLK